MKNHWLDRKNWFKNLHVIDENGWSNKVNFFTTVSDLLQRLKEMPFILVDQNTIHIFALYIDHHDQLFEQVVFQCPYNLASISSGEVVVGAFLVKHTVFTVDK